MASFAPIRGTRTQIATTPIVDGQFLVETNQGANNRIYLDTGSTRSVVGGGTGLLPHLNIIVTCDDIDTITSYSVTVTNPDGTSTTPVTYTTISSTKRLAECNVNSFGTYIIQMDFTILLNGVTPYSLTRTKAVEINSVSECNITYNYNGLFFMIDGTEDNWSEMVVQNNGTLTFTRLDSALGYKLYIFSNDTDTGDLSIPKWTNINKTISNNEMTLTYTISGGTNGSTKGVLRILR